MQIMIDGAQMPNNCHECDNLGFSDIIGLKCPAYDFDKRPKGCPLTPLPEHHGRLIDADELKEHKYHDNHRYENAVAVTYIDWAETIIEADDKESEG